MRQLLRDGATAVRVFGELPVAGTPEQVAEWIAYEAILNRAFAGRAVSILCGYDTREQPEQLVDAAWRTHPRVFGDGDENDRYRDPAEIVRLHSPSTHPPLALRPLELGDDLVALRRRLRHELEAGRGGADGCKRPAARPSARSWPTPTATAAGSAACGSAASATASSARSPTAGLASMTRWRATSPPPAGGGAGSGLWVARQLTRRLDLISTGSGLTARLWVDVVSG